MIITRYYCLLIFSVLAFIAGCEKEALEEKQELVLRQHDPEYIKKMKVHEDEQHQVIKDIHLARKEFLTAKAADPEGTGVVFKAAQEKFDAAQRKLLEARQRAQRTVAERIQRDLNQKRK